MTIDQSDELQIDFALNLADQPHGDRESYRLLMAKLFRDRPNVRRVLLSQLPGGHAGLSGATILLAHPFSNDEVEHMPLLVRIDHYAAIEREKQNYRAYIEPFIGANRTQQRSDARVDELAAVAYDYLRQRQSYQPLYTLRDFLWQEVDLPAARRAVRALFLDTLIQEPVKNGWYDDAQRYDDQRPLWFYNQIMPPALMLDQVVARDRTSAARSLGDLLAQADSPQSQALIGQTVVLSTSASYPHLRIAERDWSGGQRRLRLHLLEASPREGRLHRPSPAIAARIELLGAPDLLDQLPDDLDALAVQGRITATRYGMLDTHCRRLGRLPHQDAEGRIRLGFSTLKNPLQHYHTLLARPRPLHTSIIHGDMNLSNILLSAPPTLQSADPTAWLIDFDKTAPGGHAIFDAVKLETEYKLHILPHRLQSIDEFITLEQALHQALIDPEQPLRMLGDNVELVNAYQFIAMLRRTILCDLPQTRIPPVEYYLGLLAYGLAALKYQNLYVEHRDQWLSQAPQIEPLAVAAYLSASFAVSAIDDAETIAASPKSYSDVQQKKRPPGVRPWLVGREELLAAARRQLTAAPPLVLLYGAAGSGREAVASSLAVDLQRRGYEACPMPSTPARISTVEELIDLLRGFLQEQGVKNLPRRLAAQRSKLNAGGWQAQMSRRLNQLSQALETSPTSFVLVLRLYNPDARLCTGIAQLGRALQRTAMIVVADYPLAGLQAGEQLEVAPLTLEDVDAFVRHEQLPLAPALVEHLYAASHGLPALLTHIVKDAHTTQHRAATFEAAIQNTPVYQRVERFMQRCLEDMPDLLRTLVGLEALLHTYGAAASSDAEQLFARLSAANRWAAADETAAAIVEYRQRVLGYGGYHELLREPALHRLAGRPDFAAICGQIAQFYEERARFDRYLSARYWALAREWSVAADHLSEIAQEPEQIFTMRCPLLYKLVQELLSDGRRFHTQEAAMLELAGDCAAYLGLYQRAAAHYEALLAKSSPRNPAYARVAAQLLKTHQAAGDYQQVQRICQELRRHTANDSPLLALCLGNEGVALLAAPPLEPTRAAPLLQQAITILEQTRAQWGSAELFYEEERVRFYDYLARAAMMQGQYSPALDYLMLIRPIAQGVLRDPTLTAMIDNNLGNAYLQRGRANDMALARRCYEDSLAMREALGDVVGQLRSAQNLAILLVELARDAGDWDHAEQQYQRFEAFVNRVEAADRYLIVANHIEVLIRRGAFERARELMKQNFPEFTDPTFPYADHRLVLNIAKMALWERDAGTCHTHLARLSPSTVAGDHIQEVEWLQLMLESHLLLDTPLMLTEEQQRAYLERGSAEDEQPIDTAEWLQARGLLAFVCGDSDRALAMLQQSATLWAEVQYHYRAGMALFWLAQLQHRCGQRTDAGASAAACAALLGPFGRTPALERLTDLQRKIDQEAPQ